MQLSDAISRVRLEIGDPLQPFLTQSLGDGMTSLYDLPKQNIDAETLTVTITNGAITQNLVLNVDYIVNAELGYLQLTSPVPNGARLVTQGNAWGMFTDDDLTLFINDSINQHTQGRSIRERLRNRQGFISYRSTPMSLLNLPAIEEPLLVMLATLNVLWVLANDASTDADIVTAEGTVVNRTARYAQLMNHIAELQERYERYCGVLNVGMFRMETLKLRRISRTTGRLVPDFASREYDDHAWPARQLPPIDTPDTDDSGIPSPLWNAQGM